MRTRTRFALLAAAALIAGCGGAERAATTSTPARDTAATAGAAVPGAPMLPIEANGVLALAKDGRAKATVVNVWASWCGPCREEFPDLIAAARARAGDGARLVFVSVDFDEQLPDARAFLARNGVADTTYVKHDADQRFIDTLNPAWSGSIPATFVYDAAGRRVAFHEGRGSRDWFDGAIAKALGTGAAKGTPS